ncbi:hypothetical protein NZK35_23445 [Stieleria sp. ICT_E10.1]|uniref:hypothetical protein n=1 Tax=Stieleria sedimenti TaxID=2976331 RepID=UPI00217F841F|nr:hypothetical protein [Stieleria sedimenti]MCS7469616.1 hypothetical protein [Stieleria sedimenti]
MKFEDIHQEYSVDLILNEAPSELGSKIGGTPPVAPLPSYATPDQKYFATVEIDGRLAVSIFYSLDPTGTDAEKDMLDWNNRILPSSELIHAVVHDQGQAPMPNITPSVVSCHKLAHARRGEDVSDEGGAKFGIKIGGRPAVSLGSVCEDLFSDLVAKGYKQLLQFDTPDLMRVDFVNSYPWDPGILHVFFRETENGELEFAFVIQQ